MSKFTPSSSTSICCWNFVYDLIALIFRFILRKKTIIILVLILISLFIYILTLFWTNQSQYKNFPREDTINQRQHSTSILESDDLNHDNYAQRDNHGFASLKRQHRLKEKHEDPSEVEMKNIVQIGRPLLNDVVIDNHNQKSNSQFFSDDNQLSLLSEGAATVIKCRNSVQGKLLLADDRGQVCQRRHLSLNGCCDEKHSGTKKFVCDSCQEKGCCAIYEHCISCCMSPQNRDYLNKMVQHIDKNSNKQTETLKIFISSISDSFELCLIICRTSSSSVLHENTYKNPSAKYCYQIED